MYIRLKTSPASAVGGMSSYNQSSYLSTGIVVDPSKYATMFFMLHLWPPQTNIPINVSVICCQADEKVFVDIREVGQ
jgi:hypothetical protein